MFSPGILAVTWDTASVIGVCLFAVVFLSLVWRGVFQIGRGIWYLSDISTKVDSQGATLKEQGDTIKDLSRGVWDQIRTHEERLDDHDLRINKLEGHKRP